MQEPCEYPWSLSRPRAINMTTTTKETTTKATSSKKKKYIYIYIYIYIYSFETYQRVIHPQDIYIFKIYTSSTYIYSLYTVRICQKNEYSKKMNLYMVCLLTYRLKIVSFSKWFKILTILRCIDIISDQFFDDSDFSKNTFQKLVPWSFLDFS